MTTMIPGMDISDIFAGIPSKVLARMIGRPHTTVADCRQGRSKWRAEDLIAAARHSAEVRAKTIAYLKSLDDIECAP